MIRALSLAVILLLGGYVYGQQSCLQKLIRAEELYQSGRLLEIEVLLTTCLKNEGFIESEAIRARKLLTKVALFTDNEQRAEEEFIQLLTLDPVHHLQPEDPSELRVLMAKFRTWPSYRLEFKLGGNLTFAGSAQSFSAIPAGADHKEPSPGFGGQFEVNITKHLFSGIEVGGGFQYRSSNYSVISTPDGDEFITNITSSQSMLRMPIFGRYNFNYSYLGDRKFTPFVFAGVSLDYIAKAQYKEASRSGGTSVTISPDQADLKEFNQVNEINSSIFAGLGVKLSLKKGNFLLVEGRYDRGLMLFNIPEGRYANTKIIGDLMYVEDDVFLNFVSVNVGFVWSVFKPEKLTK